MTENDKAQLILDEIGILQKKKPISASTVKASYLKQRLKDWSDEQLIAFVNWQWKQWENWELRENYFRPETLFQKKRVSEAMDKVSLGEQPLSPQPTDGKTVVKKDQCSLIDYTSYVLAPTRYYGYHYRRMTDLKKKKIDQLILEDYQSGKPAYHCLKLNIFEQIRKEENVRSKEQIRQTA
jgi:uncharacterized phage protein (TIGR02220 family)